MYITGCLKLDTESCSHLRWPSSLIHLGIEDCIDVAEYKFAIFLSALGAQLQSLAVGEGMASFGDGTLRRALSVLPCIHTLKCGIDHVRYGLFGPSQMMDYPGLSPLVHLELTHFGRNHTSPWRWVWHLVMHGVFPHLRQVRVRRYAPWMNPFGEHLQASSEGEPRVIDERQGGTWLIPGPSGPVEYCLVEALWNDGQPPP